MRLLEIKIQTHERRCAADRQEHNAPRISPETGLDRKTIGRYLDQGQAH
jgi:hypothetical protein